MTDAQKRTNDIIGDRKKLHLDDCKYPCPDPWCPNGNAVKGFYLDYPEFGVLGGDTIRKRRVVEMSDERWWYAWRPENECASLRIICVKEKP